jgi:hypothetical protein
MERYCSTGQSSQRAVAPTEEKEKYEEYNKTYLGFLRKMPESFVLFEPDNIWRFSTDIYETH